MYRATATRCVRYLRVPAIPVEASDDTKMAVRRLSVTVQHALAMVDDQRNINL